MNTYMDFDPYYIRERNEGVLGEVSTHRLEKWLRRERRPSTSQLGALVSRSMLPLLRGIGLTGR